MQAQFEFSQSERFQVFMNGLLSADRFNQENIVGVTIDFHPLWWGLATFWRETGGVDYSEAIFPFWTWSPARLTPRPDPTWIPSYWESICKNHGKDPSPFLIKI